MSHHGSSMLSMILPNPSRGRPSTSPGWVDARSLPRGAEMCVCVAFTHRSPRIPPWGIPHLLFSPCRVSALRQQSIHNLFHIIIPVQEFWGKCHGWALAGTTWTHSGYNSGAFEWLFGIHLSLQSSTSNRIHCLPPLHSMP